MIELDKTFTMQNLANETKTTFEGVLFNNSLSSSNPGNLVFTRDKVYFLLDYNNVGPKKLFAKEPTSWCIDISEIVSYGRRALAGYKITLADGTVLIFSNIFRKLRSGITEAIEQRKK